MRRNHYICSVWAFSRRLVLAARLRTKSANAIIRLWNRQFAAQDCGEGSLEVVSGDGNSLRKNRDAIILVVKVTIYRQGSRRGVSRGEPEGREISRCDQTRPKVSCSIGGRAEPGIQGGPPWRPPGDFLEILGARGGEHVVFMC